MRSEIWIIWMNSIIVIPMHLHYSIRSEKWWCLDIIVIIKLPEKWCDRTVDLLFFWWGLLWGFGRVLRGTVSGASMTDNEMIKSKIQVRWEEDGRWRWGRWVQMGVPLGILVSLSGMVRGGKGRRLCHSLPTHECSEASNQYCCIKIQKAAL